MNCEVAHLQSHRIASGSSLLASYTTQDLVGRMRADPVGKSVDLQHHIADYAALLHRFMRFCDLGQGKSRGGSISVGAKVKQPRPLLVTHEKLAATAIERDEFHGNGTTASGREVGPSPNCSSNFLLASLLCDSHFDNVATTPVHLAFHRDSRSIRIVLLKILPVSAVHTAAH